MATRGRQPLNPRPSAAAPGAGGRRMTTKPSRSRHAIRRSATIDAKSSADCAFAKRPSLVSA